MRQSSNASEYGGSCSTERAQSKISHQSGPPLLKPNGTCNGDLELPSRPVLCKPTLRLDGYGNRKRRTLTLNRKSKMLNPKSKRKESETFASLNLMSLTYKGGPEGMVLLILQGPRKTLYPSPVNSTLRSYLTPISIHAVLWLGPVM